MSKKTHLYLSGPMTDMPDLNFPLFFNTAARLRCAGYQVTNPAELNMDKGAGWSSCLRADLRALLDCEAICLLPDWQLSKGARLERHNAAALGMPIHMVQDLLPDFMGRATETPDVLVNSHEVEQLANMCAVDRSLALASHDGRVYLAGDRPENQWAFAVVRGWRWPKTHPGMAGLPLPQCDVLMTEDEHRALQRVCRPEQSLTIRNSALGFVLVADESGNRWAFELLQRMRKTEREAA